jgi:tripartite-type tricarboxylate transporter receptor subunit TctC
LERVHDQSEIGPPEISAFGRRHRRFAGRLADRRSAVISNAAGAETRSEVLPEVATVNSFVPGYEASYVNGIGVPKNTPNEIIDLLNSEINASLADPRVKAPLTELGVTPFRGSPADFKRRIAEDTEKWAKVMFASIKAE